MNGAATRGGDFVASVKRANTCAITRGSLSLSRAGSLYGRMRIFSCDGGCARVRKPNTPSVSAPLTVPSLTSRRISPCFRNDVPDPTYRPAPGRRIADCRWVRRREETNGISSAPQTCEDVRRPRADIVCPCGATTPYRRRCEWIPTTAVLAQPQATYRKRSRAAYPLPSLTSHGTLFQ